MRETSQHTPELLCANFSAPENGSESAVIRVPTSTKSGDEDIFLRLRQSRFGHIYQSRLKNIPPIRFVVIWAWQTIYPLYLKYNIGDSGRGHRRWRRLLKFSEYVEENPDKVHTLLRAAVFDVPLPGVNLSEDENIFSTLPCRYDFPEVQVAIISDAVQYGGSNMVLLGDQVIHHDLYNFTKDYTSEELHGRASIDPKRNRIRWLSNDEDPHVISVAATFTDACAGNYAHWMTEVLPRIMLFCSDAHFSDIPIVVNDGLHENIMKSLFLVAGGGRRIIVLPIGRALLIKNLYLTSVVGYVPFDRRSTKSANDSHGIFSPLALEQLSRHLTDSLDRGSDVSLSRKYYLRRNSKTRNIENAAEIENLLSGYGFSTLDPETLSFSEQVRVFRNAEMVVGATGAAFANAIFGRRGSCVAIMMGKHESMIYRYWCNMLSPLGIDVRYVLGRITGNQHLGIHGNFHIACQDIVDLVESLGCVKQQKAVIHSSAIVSPLAQLGEGVEIGPFSIVHRNVSLGNRVKVGAYCELGIETQLGDGSPLVIGDDALIRSHSVFYESSRFAPGLVTGHRVTVRENTNAGAGFQIGTLSEIQGDCAIGDYVRFQSNVFVGKKTTIGNYVWVLPYVVLTNDPTPPSNDLIGCKIEDFASISAASVILPGVKVGHHSLVAAQACVSKDVAPHTVVAGVPARAVADANAIKLRDGSGRAAYPWTDHFTRGYPEHIVETWKSGEDDED